MFYWWYRINDLVMAAQAQALRPYRSDNRLLFIVLRIFGLSVINMAILQADLNDVYEHLNIEVSGLNTTGDDEWSDY